MKRRHLLWIDDAGAIIEIDRHTTTSGDYGQLYDAMKQQAGARDKFSFAEIVELDEQQCREGVYWDWELAGPGGASYRIHILPDVTDEAVDKCIAHIHHTADCIRLIRNRITRLIDFRFPEFQHVEIDMGNGYTR